MDDDNAMDCSTAVRGQKLTRMPMQRLPLRRRRRRRRRDRRLRLLANRGRQDLRGMKLTIISNIDGVGVGAIKARRSAQRSRRPGRVRKSSRRRRRRRRSTRVSDAGPLFSRRAHAAAPGHPCGRLLATAVRTSRCPPAFCSTRIRAAVSSDATRVEVMRVSTCVQGSSCMHTCMMPKGIDGKRLGGNTLVDCIPRRCGCVVERMNAHVCACL